MQRIIVSSDSEESEEQTLEINESPEINESTENNESLQTPEILDLKFNSEDYQKTLKKYFGFNTFRGKQREIIDQLLVSKKDVIGVLPTGQGKSLCYQFPAVYTQKTSVVISPLLSLMEDQKMSLLSKNISCCTLSGSTKHLYETINEAIDGKYKVVYTTPEFMESKGTFLNYMFENGHLGLLAVDEAHCISQWGHDFRMSYRNLAGLRNLIPNVPILALTATATPTIIKDIGESMGLKRPSIIQASTVRPNLGIWVREKEGDVMSNLREVLDPPDSETTTIIYVSTRKDSESVRDILRKNKYKTAEAYHAGLSDAERERIHHDFIYDRCTLVVATIAFGMGIDKPNIRKIINWGIPQNLETYYQEIGRAGRDGLESHCYLFWSSRDFHIHKFLISKHLNPQVEAHHLHLLKIIRNWANSNVCRQLQIDSYFQREELYYDWPASADSNKCQKCDNCLLRNARSTLPSNTKLRSSMISKIASKKDLDSDNSDETNNKNDNIEVGKEAELLIKMVRSLNYNYGWTNLVGILTGSKAKSFNAKLVKNPYYDKGSYKTQVWWRAFGELMIDLDYLKYVKLGGLYSKRKAGSKSKGVVQLVGLGKKQLKLDENGELWVRPNAQLIKLSKVKEQANLGHRSTELLKELKVFRQEQAQIHQLPPYLLLPDPVMMEIVKTEGLLTMRKLMQIDGMTSQSIQKIGLPLIELVNQSSNSKENPKFLSSSTTSKLSDNPRLNANQQRTYELLKDFTGGDWKKIIKEADECKIKPETAENHIVKLVGLNLLSKDPYILGDHFEKITKYLATSEAMETKLLRDKRLKIAEIYGFEPNYLELKICLELYNN